jgi:hypothetical protein
MYAPGTKLKLIKPRSKPKKGDQEAETFAYDEIKVVGVSPVSHAHKGEWEGADAVGVIIEPLTDFAGNLDEPFGKLRAMYQVTEEVPHEAPTATRVFTEEVAVPSRKSPEEQFLEEIPPGTRKSPTRARTPHGDDSPLGDVTPPDKKSPLDD